MHPQNLMGSVTSAVMAFLKQGAGTGILPALWWFRAEISDNWKGNSVILSA